MVPTEAIANEAVAQKPAPDKWPQATQPVLPIVLSNMRPASLEEADEPIHNAELHWYSPYSVVKERENYLRALRKVAQVDIKL